MTSEPAIPEGYVLVPREPTDFMITAGLGEWLGHGTKSLSEEWRGYISKTYAAMVAEATRATPSLQKPQGSPLGDEGSEFVREERYIVIKRKNLNPLQEGVLKYNLREAGIQTVECVVVERDWPEYETVWGMIEARVTGAFPASRDEEVAGITAVWAQAEENHRRYSDTGDQEGDIRFLTLGLTGEAGEVANFVKKRWRDGDGHDEDIRKEIADVCAYAFMLANTMGMSPADLIHTIADKQAVFVAKMSARDAAPAGEKL